MRCVIRPTYPGCMRSLGTWARLLHVEINTGTGSIPGHTTSVARSICFASLLHCFLATERYAPSGEKYFSFASMVIPSNDGFIGNDDPRAYSVFDDQGRVRSYDIVVNGDQVLDAGSEQNTEMNAAVFNQMAANTGTPQNDVVARHPRFNGSIGYPDGTPKIILAGTICWGC